MDDARIPILVEEWAGHERRFEPIRIGLPIPRGLLRRGSVMSLRNEVGDGMPCQTVALTHWPDGSVKWLLVDALISVRGRERIQFYVTASQSEGVTKFPMPTLRVEAGERFLIDTGVASFTIRRGPELIEAISINGETILDRAGVHLTLTGCRGKPYRPLVRDVRLEEVGPVRATLAMDGHFVPFDATTQRPAPVEFQARLTFTGGSALVRLDVQVHNPRAARHPGGLWDLDDQGTALFEDISLSLKPIDSVRELRWYAESAMNAHVETPNELILYQDSSGGENWDSENHVDGSGRSTVTFRGYRVTYGPHDNMRLIAEGDRPTPGLTVVTERCCISATVLDFWQSFPKALRWSDQILDVALFPWECRAPFALQGGERKRQTVLLEFSAAGAVSTLSLAQHPVRVTLDPGWVQESGAIDEFIAAERDGNSDYLCYVQSIIEGPHSFFAKRELIDEYGWRHFGDIYADHEAVQARGFRPLVSHYNNQYDFIYGALIHHLRTGDMRWRVLAEDAARHTIDIDIYHTDEDKPAFNHGLFWHTDHYRPAATCTHRTYSGKNGRTLAYGGGPSNEHNYTSGLLLYYFLSGDPEAAASVRELANWVIAMDRGSGNGMGARTGLASKTVDPGYHGPGRGAGNSINALLDAFQMTKERCYLDKAEELIVRCVHPRDDVAALRLEEPEIRWSYLVFFQALGKHLHVKLELGELDEAFHYARESLLHYARWMLHNEVPYKDVLERVLLPTETWPAQDVRKCHVLHLAGEFSADPERTAFHRKADFFFERCMQDLLSFETAYLTRPLVILCVFGHLQAYYQAHLTEGFELSCPIGGFKAPSAFSPEQLAWPAKVRELGSRLVRTGAERLDVLGRLSTPLRL